MNHLMKRIEVEVNQMMAQINQKHQKKVKKVQKQKKVENPLNL